MPTNLRPRLIDPATGLEIPTLEELNAQQRFGVPGFPMDQAQRGGGRISPVPVSPISPQLQQYESVANVSRDTLRPMPPPPPGGRNLGPAYDPMAGVDPGLRIRGAGMAAYGDSMRESEAQQLQMEAMRNQVATQRRALEPVPLPGMEPQDPRALPYLSARAASEERERAREEAARATAAYRESQQAAAADRLKMQGELNQSRMDAADARSGSFMPLTDNQGRVTGAWNPKTKTYEPVPEAAAGARRSAVPSSVNTKIAEYENAARKITDLGTAYRPEFVGPVEGRWEKSKAQGVLSFLPFLQTPEGYGQFMALNADLKNSVIKLVTGAQMGVQEAQRILQQVPVETDKDELWAAKYEQTQKNTDFLLNRIRELSGAGGESAAPAQPQGGGGERTATNPQTGEKLVLRNGQWVPMQ